ncbi:MAG: hypothetical protein U9P42_00985 [Candidatus Fermentibacteria bacterium]|nr:hypothetical protein [Candidatus Fermentibacteria bacterium]
MTEKQTEKNKPVEFEERHRKQMKTVALFGIIEFDPDYDYKKQRKLDTAIFPREEK